MVIKGAQALAQRALGLLRDRLMRKDMEAVLERLSGLDTSQGEPLSEEEVEVRLLDGWGRAGQGQGYVECGVHQPGAAGVFPSRRRAGD